MIMPTYWDADPAPKPAPPKPDERHVVARAQTLIQKYARELRDFMRDPYRLKRYENYRRDTRGPDPRD